MGLGRMQFCYWALLLLVSCFQLTCGDIAAAGNRRVLEDYRTGANFTGQLRLPKFAVPSRYELRLKPDLVNFTFSGSVKIELDIVSETKFLVYNAAALTIFLGEISFNSSKFDKVFKPSQSWQFEEDQIMVLEFDENLPVGSGVLSISNFQGTLNDELRGFYRSYYFVNGEKRYMAVTQFEPLDARRCFPCWDEPALKATFKITLDVPSDLMALSNMPLTEEKIDGNLKTVSYQESPVMSTYLVAVVVGLFDYVEDHTSDGAKVRVYCPVGKSDYGTYALDVAVKSLEIYKKFFALPYALPKLDLIGIPQFAAGAMENWGLVTFKTGLLYTQPGFGNSQIVASVIAHELGHQWTGDLVTMEWWTHLWLNEGFATWLSSYAVSRMLPDSNTSLTFTKSNAGTLRTDALPTSHPIEVPIHNASEINGIFDTITYNKGAAVLRMLQTYLSPRVFQRSLAAYVKQYSWSNANTEDLWAVLGKVSAMPVRQVMSPWTKQAGFPLIYAKVHHQRLELKQTQFLSTGLHGNGKWTVPITLCCGSYQTCHSFLLNEKSESIDIKELAGCSCSKESEKDSEGCPWIKINVNQTGFYRVKYGEDLAARLRHAIAQKHLSGSDRFGVLDDLEAISAAYQLPLTYLLTLMDAYADNPKDDELFNLLRITTGVAEIAADAAPEQMGCINKIFISLFKNSGQKLGWDPKQNYSLLNPSPRTSVLTTLALLGDEGTIQEATRRFHIYLNNRSTSLFDPQIRQAAYVGVMQNVSSSNRDNYEAIKKLYWESNDTDDSLIILRSLTSCPDAQIVLEALNFMISPMIPTRLSSVALSNPTRHGREITWLWLKDNWDSLLKIFDVEIDFIISNIVSPFASVEKASEVREFFATRALPSFADTVEKSIQQILKNASNYTLSLQTYNSNNIIDPVPSLFTFKVADSQLAELSGVTFPKVKAKLQLQDMKRNIPQLTQVGPMLVTHWGLSGPVILRLSAWGARNLFETEYRSNLIVDFSPDIHLEDLKALLSRRHKEQYANQKIVNSHPSELGLVERFWKYVLDREGIDGDILWASVSNNAITAVSSLLKNCSFGVTGKGQFKEEFFTAGGVPLSEISLHTMESKIQPRLFFAGEVLNIDRVKNLMIMLFETAFLNLGFSLSLDDHAILVRYITKFIMFSLPRPPEVGDLEDKVNFKDGGMLRNGILGNLGGLLVIWYNLDMYKTKCKPDN
ncbi:unnamed protein product [Rhodiola kirilowii]